MANQSEQFRVAPLTAPQGVTSDQALEPVSAGRRRIWGWLDDRLGLSALRYNIPAHANTFWYTLGGITLFGILVLVATGIWLAQYYNPDPAAARQSVLYIQNVAPLGDIIRGIHVWTAYLVVLTAALHLIRIVVTACTVLRWDQEAYEAMLHNMALTNLLGALGGFFSDAFTTSVPMLPRLYSLHVSIVPLILALLLIAHFFLVKRHGISPTPTQADAGVAPRGRLPKDKETDLYPTHLRLMFGYGLALVALAGVIGVLFPQPIGPAADPTMEVTKPPFLFYWLYAFEDWFGIPGILYSAVGMFGLLAIFPFIDRTPLRHLRRRPMVMVLGLALLIAIVVLSILVAVSPAAKHLG